MLQSILLHVVAALLQLWKAFRQHNYALHRRLGYMAVAATGLGSMSAAPYAFTYLLSMQMPETVSRYHLLSEYAAASQCLLPVVMMLMATTETGSSNHQALYQSC